MMQIGIIGAGSLGSALGQSLGEGGHEVMFGGGGSAHAVAGAPETRVGSNADAVSFGEVVVLAVPFSAVDSALAEAGPLGDRVLWSCVNALKPDFSGLAVGFNTSAAETVAARAQGARVVAAIPPFANAIASGQLAYDAGLEPTVFLCGDDEAAKRAVEALIRDIGAQPVDAGALSAARLVEPAMMLLVSLAYSGVPRDISLRLLERTGMPESRADAPEVTVHRHVASALPVNAYLVETPSGVVAVDTTLTVSDARAMRQRAADLGKPLQAVLITHAHPDHYGGGVELVGSDEVPIVAAAGVDAVIRRDDEIKEGVIRPMFGDEWPRERRFPNQTLADGESISFDGVSFTLMDLGPGESPHDSVWLVGDERLVAFAGDTAYQQMHCFLADGFWEEWLANIKRLRAQLAPDAQIHFGHGDPAATPPFEWQEGYINTFVEATRDADWSDSDAAKAKVIERMTDYLPTGDLQFLMELSIEPVAVKLGLLSARADEGEQG